MPANQEQIEGLLGVIQAADAAVMEIYGQESIEVKIKSDRTPLTEADLASHRIILQGLKRLFPDTPVVSEEGDEDVNRKLVRAADRFLLVDPLDGTREFIDRTGHFTVCAALIEEGQPTFGIVSAPALGVTYYGGPELGSYLKDQRSTRLIESSLPHDRPIVLISRTDANKQTTDYIVEHYPGCETVVVGSQLKLPLIAEGRGDYYPRIDGPLHLWDLAAGHAILLGGGGNVSRPDGTLVDYDNSSLMAGDFVAMGRTAA